MTFPQPISNIKKDDEIARLNTGSELSLTSFLNFVSEEMKLDMPSPGLRGQLSAGLSEVQKSPLSPHRMSRFAVNYLTPLLWSG
jgi:hypothetical protein